MRLLLFVAAQILVLAVFIYVARADACCIPPKAAVVAQPPPPPSNEDTVNSWCALTKESINLRAGPDTGMPVVTKLRGRELIVIATARCATMKGAVACTDKEGWGYVESVPRLDNNRNAFTTGWVKIANVRKTECK